MPALNTTACICGNCCKQEIERANEYQGCCELETPNFTHEEAGLRQPCHGAKHSMGAQTNLWSRTRHALGNSSKRQSPFVLKTHSNKACGKGLQNDAGRQWQPMGLDQSIKFFTRHLGPYHEKSDNSSGSNSDCCLEHLIHASGHELRAAGTHTGIAVLSLRNRGSSNFL